MVFASLNAVTNASSLVEIEEVSVLEDIDFELELIHRDEINVAYILNLLAGITGLDENEKKKRQKEIIDLVAGEVQLRSKRELIEKFIDENLPSLQPNVNVVNEFENYWSESKKRAFDNLCAEEKMLPAQLEQIVSNYGYYNRLPKTQDIASALSFQPKILERKTILQRVGDKIQDFINTFIDGMG
jgi:type I restriction enzyme R subunit